ncbi:hypothetical protein [Streptomyces venezuelae]|uniref:hypothetical protein n=1 Tax=Streptomyces venezuelae TaxID=54571 RepID=UPI00123CE1B8|nr:hypothetical protein [Streptomyces venezuelae]
MITVVVALGTIGDLVEGLFHPLFIGIVVLFGPTSYLPPRACDRSPSPRVVADQSSSHPPSWSTHAVEGHGNGYAS